MDDTIIEIFEGRLGGGKTYSAVERIFAHLCRGGIVYTNVRLKWDNILASAKNRGFILDDLQYQYLTNEQIKEFNKHIAPGTEAMPVLVVIDEAHLFFNARDWNKTGRIICDTLTQIRKVMINLLLITQSALNLDKQFVRMVQYIWRFRDMRKMTVPVLGIRYPFNQILQACFDAQDSKYQIGRWFKTKNKEVFGWYDSKALFTDLGLLSEPPKVNMKKMTRAEILEHRKASFVKIKTDILASIKTTSKANIMKALLIILALIAVFTFSARHLLGGSKSASTTSAPPPTLTQATSRVFGGDSSNQKKDVQVYHSNLSAYLDGSPIIRVGGKFNGHVVLEIDPVRSLVVLDDGSVFSL